MLFVRNVCGKWNAFPTNVMPTSSIYSVRMNVNAPLTKFNWNILILNKRKTWGVTQFGEVHDISSSYYSRDIIFFIYATKKMSIIYVFLIVSFIFEEYCPTHIYNQTSKMPWVSVCFIDSDTQTEAVERNNCQDNFLTVQSYEVAHPWIYIPNMTGSYTSWDIFKKNSSK